MADPGVSSVLGACGPGVNADDAYRVPEPLSADLIGPPGAFPGCREPDPLPPCD